MKYISKTDLITQKLKELDILDSFSKKEYLISLYGKMQTRELDYRNSRSFDVLLIRVKKELSPKKFRTINRQITRIA